MMTRNIFYIVVILVLLVGGSVLAFLLLPIALDQFVLPQISQKLPFNSSQINLAKISPWQIRGTLYLGDQESRGVVVPNFEIHFEPNNLWKKKISQIIIEAPVVHLERKAGKLTVRGLKSERTAEKNRSSVKLADLPIAIEKITIRDGLIVYHENELRRHNLNIGGNILPSYGEDTEERISLKSITAKILTHGVLPSITDMQLAVTDEGIMASYAAQIQDLDSILPNLPQLEQMEIGGTAIISGTVQTDGKKSVKNSAAKITIANFLAKRSGVEIRSKSEQEPIIISFNSIGRSIDFSLSQLALHKPATANFNLEGKFDLASSS